MTTKYVSIFEKIIGEMEEQGHKTFRMNLNEERAEFNLPPEMKRPTIASIAGEQTATSSGFSKGKTDGKQLNLPGSSTIQSAAYWPTRAYLLVSFKSGHTYSYTEVGPWTINDWEQASSAGSWFYYNIRMSFKYQKM